MADETKVTWLPSGTTLEGRWVLDGRLGRGGFASVYSARHKKLGRSAAVKILDIQTNPDDMLIFHERFLREAKLSAQLEHPNVVQILDYGIYESERGLEKPFIVMELLRGHDLEHELLEHGPLEPERAARLFAGALDALALSHRRGVVHRDLKPSNLFLTHPNEPEERLIIVDFGIARAFDDPNSKLTATNHFTGTPAYLAPEYISEQRVTPALDVYQMGLIISESLTGKPVVMASAPLGYLMAHCNGQQHIQPYLLQTPVGRELERAVRVNPHARHTNAGELRDALAGCDWSLIPPFDEHLMEPLVSTFPELGGDTLEPGVSPFALTDLHQTPAALLSTPSTPAPPAPPPRLPTEDLEETPHTSHPSRRVLYLVAALAICALMLGSAALGALFLLKDRGTPATPSVIRAPTELAPTTSSPLAQRPADPQPAHTAPAHTAPPHELAQATTQTTTPLASQGAASTARAGEKPSPKVIAAEPIEVLTSEDVDQKLRRAYEAYRVAVGVRSDFAAYERVLSTSSFDDPSEVSSIFSRTWPDQERSVKHLRRLPLMPPAHPGLDAAASALAASMASVAEHSKLANQYREERKWREDPGGLRVIDRRYREVYAQYDRALTVFNEALYALEVETLRARFARTHARTGPIMHHLHGALLESALAMAAAELSSLDAARPHIRKLEAHLKALAAYREDPIHPDLSSTARNQIVSMITALKVMPAKFRHIKKLSSPSALKTPEVFRHDLAVVWTYASMTHALAARRYHERKF